MSDDRYPAMPYWARITLTVATVLVLLAAAWVVRNILLLVLVATILALGLEPQVRWLERRRSYLARLRRSTGFLGTLEARMHLSDRLQQASSRLPDLAEGKIPSLAAGLGSAIANTLVVAVLTIYTLLSLEQSRGTARAIVGRKDPERNRRILDTSVERIGAYVSGNIFISVITGVSAFVALEILRVPFAAALALWVAIADLIPGIGATLGAVVCIVVALFTSLTDAIVLTIYFVVYQRIENYLILPRVMGKAIDLSAPTVIVTLLIGSRLAGLTGALVALPIVAVLKVVVEELWLGSGDETLPADESAGSSAGSAADVNDP